MLGRLAVISGSLVLLTNSAFAEVLETLSDKSSGRMFAIRVTPPAVPTTASAAPPAAAALSTTADEFTAANRALIGIEDPARDLVATPATTDRLGLSRVKYFQRHQGLDVLGGEVAVHLNRAGQVTYVKTKVARDLPEETTPRITATQAEEAALRVAMARAPAVTLTILRTRLLVLPLGIAKNEPSEGTRLAWEVEVADAETGGERYGEAIYVDAASGERLLQLTRIQRYTPVTRQVYDCAAGPSAGTCQLDVESTTYPGYFHGRSEGMPARGPFPNPSFPLFYGSTDVDSLYSRLEALHAYFSTTFGIDGANGHGGLADWPNVPWNITRGVAHNDYTGFNPPCPQGLGYFSRNTGTMTFCRGAFVPDVAGHEYAHGIVHHSFHDGSGYPVGITYYGQSGSLDEGFADFMGEVFEFANGGSTDWISGTGSGYTYRNLANPPALLRWDGDSLPYPARFHDPNFYCGPSDAGGAHMNLTVPAHALYLIAQGGQHATNGCAVQAQGIDVAQQVFFRGWRSYFSGTESFNEAYADLIQACNDLYPAGVCAEVTKALQAVEMDQPGLCSGIPETQPPCSLVGVEDRRVLALDGVWLLGPQPAHGNIHFAYRTAHDGRVEVRVHDIVGRLLARPIRAHQLAGEQRGVWDGRLETGERAKPGAYFLSATLDGQPIGVRKLLILR